jgi:hypothetical protein
VSDAPMTDPTAETAPTEETSVDPTLRDTPAVPASTSSDRAKRSVAVPVWLLALLGVAVLVVGAFFVGRSTANETSGTSGPKTLSAAVEESARGELPVGEFDANQLLDAIRQNPNLAQELLGYLLGNGGGR